MAGSGRVVRSIIKMLAYLAYLLAVLCSANCATFYDSYTGQPITKEEVKRHDKANNTFWCVNEIEPCDPDEFRRVDGSCNNLENPTRGAAHTPFVRVLPPIYSEGFEPKKAKSGNNLPLARKLRTSLLADGTVPGQTFTQLAVNVWVFATADVVSLHDTVKYIAWKPYCCLPKGKTDRDCVPNQVPHDDRVFRFSDIRCLNLTRPESFQSIGCVPNNTVPERIVSSTPLIDLSVIYGNHLSSLLKKGRLFEKGLLKFEVSNGKIWPPSTKTQANVCFLNDKVQETRCHETPEDGLNTLAGINMVGVWVWRLHNVIANNLAAVNPCWDDDMLFYTARDINIAIFLQIYYYELLPIFFGRDNLIKDGMISPSLGHRDLYNPKILPQLSLEYPFVSRWVHVIQEGSLKMYDADGYYLKKYPIVNLTLKTGFFDVDENMEQLTRGNFLQTSAKIDYIIDPDIGTVGLGPHQRASDLCTSDAAKNRYFGFQSYVKYRDFCFGKPIRSFDDLDGIIDPERIEILKDLYESFEDIDLIVGIWVEKPIKGGFVPPTMYCLVVEQLIRNMISDRHWYERPNRPHAFNLEQLLEIRRYTVARLLCDVGDKVTRIQPSAFLKAGKYNQLRDCKSIPSLNYWAWRDSSCQQNDERGDNYGKN
ncbi:hypothetical protein K1T71_004257 [Dendrolimus kikuchii]|uniref:Uncharacterized protein n=1 Tax=Dendrolimus kikuchii TaxID=765133 RepID=A0ACC1D706_9NEOP|nr:hypothetical protein K1T71_004257 [Dendrolimus kikuchii]